MWKQIKDNSIALLSLLIAIIALLYTTWREEITERNRSYRVASFEVLKNLGQLQIIANHARYQPESSIGNPIQGWGHVAMIGDMGELLPPPIPEKTKEVVNVWGEESQNLKTDEGINKVSEKIDAARQSVLETIRQLR